MVQYPGEFWKDYEILDFEIPKVKQQKDLCEKYSQLKDNKNNITTIFFLLNLTI